MQSEIGAGPSARYSFLASRMRPLFRWLNRRGRLKQKAQSIGISARVRYLDAVFDLFPLGNYTEKFFYFKGRPPEPESIALLREHAAPGGAFLDVGANCGVYSVLIAKRLGAEGRVIAVEPLPDMRQRLARNLRINGLDGCVTVKPVALAAAEGVAHLNVHPENFGQSSLRSVSESHVIEVPTLPLADLARELADRRPFLLKMDIEGYEGVVLEAFLTSAPDALLPDAALVETAHADQWPAGVFELFASRGYSTEAELEGNTLFVRRAA